MKYPKKEFGLTHVTAYDFTKLNIYDVLSLAFIVEEHRYIP